MKSFHFDINKKVVFKIWVFKKEKALHDTNLNIITLMWHKIKLKLIKICFILINNGEFVSCWSIYKKKKVNYAIFSTVGMWKIKRENNM